MVWLTSLPKATQLLCERADIQTQGPTCCAYSALTTAGGWALPGQLSQPCSVPDGTGARFTLAVLPLLSDRAATGSIMNPVEAESR